MNPRFDAYAAGLVDGEGCITAKSNKTGLGTAIRVLIGMATKSAVVLQRMQDAYGGTLITQEPSSPEHSLIMTWTVTGGEAAAFLRRIEPHLMLKSEQAAVALKINEIRTSQERIGQRDHYRWTQESSERCAILHRRLNELNERGREPLTTSTAIPFARLVAGQWVTNQADLFSDLGWEPYSATWPRSGFMCGGRAYELPMSVPRTSASGCSSSLLLPTPCAQNGEQRNQNIWERDESEPQNLENALARVPLVAELLPTPRATDGTKGGPNQRGSSGDLMLPSAVLDL